MQKNYNIIFCNLFFLIAIFTTTFVQAEPERCHHCMRTAHESTDELCSRCGRKLEDCEFTHNFITPISPEEIVNTSELNKLMDILFRLKDKYLAKTGRNLPTHEIFSKANEILAEHGVILPKAGLRKMKEEVTRRENNQLYLARCVRSMPKGFEDSEEYKVMLEVSKSAVTYDEDDEVAYPLKLKCGIFLTWCGAAMTILSDGILAPAGYWVASTGAVMAADGVVEYNERLAQHRHQQAEKARLKAEKEAKDAAKKESKAAEKAEKARLREIEKQKEKAEKEERRRQKEERRKNENR